MFEFPEYTIRALTGLRISDAIGAPYEYNPHGHEYVKQSMAEKRFLCSVTDCLGPTVRYRMPGCYTDDTQQSLILLWCWKQMVDRNLADPAQHPEQVGELFMRICLRMSQEDIGYHPGYFGIHRGTGSNFRAAVKNPAEPPYTAGMGSVMRIGPVATLLPNENQVAEWAVTVSRRTTSDPMGLAAAAYYARAAWRLSRGLGIRTGMADTLADTEVDICYQQIHLWHEHLKQGASPKLPSIRLSETLEAVNQYRQNHSPDLFNPEEPLENFCTGYGPTGVLWALASVHYKWDIIDILSTEDIRGTDTDTIGAICLCLCSLVDSTVVPAWALTQAVPLNIYTWHPIETERALCLQEIESKINLINTNRVDTTHVQS